MEVWSGENGEKMVWFEEEGKMIWGKKGEGGFKNERAASSGLLAAARVLVSQVRDPNLN